MIIEYKDTARSIHLATKNWDAYLYDRKRNTNIVHELLETLKANNSLGFEDLQGILRLAYSSRKSKARIEFYFDKDTIEITNKGVFPNILIRKK